MAVITDVELSTLIVSVANAMVEANEVLNEDPTAGLAITEFSVDISMVATLTVPSRVPEPRFRLLRAGDGTFRAAQLASRIPAARLGQVLAPSATELALPASLSQTSTVQVHAVISTVPTTS